MLKVVVRIRVEVVFVVTVIVPIGEVVAKEVEKVVVED